MKSIEWAAGLFEGEGSISHTIANGKQYPRLSLGMCDKDIVEDFARVVGYGNVTGPRQQKADWSPRYDWQICKRSEIKRILELFMPYLGLRRGYKALNCLDDIDNHLFLKGKNYGQRLVSER